MASNYNKLTSSRVAIIGAGVSGLAAAKNLAHHNPTVFEASDSVGGVWRSCTYETTKLQSARVDYEFSDFPWPSRDDPTFPSYVEILDYLESYAKHFDLLKFMKFGSKVIEVRFTGDGETPQMVDLGAYGNLLPGKPVWEVAVQTGDSGDIQWHAFEFVVVCTGKFGDVPRIPAFPAMKGPEIFKGKVMHSMDYCKLEKEEASSLLHGKKVAVIGFKKSAIDLAFESALANQGEGGKACTMVVRTTHWVFPHYWVWGLPFFLFYSTRASQFLHDRPNQSFLRTLFCLLFSLLRAAVSKFIEAYVMWKLPLAKYGLKPDHSFEEDYASCQMAIVPENFFEEADKGMIRFKKASKWCFYDEGIEFDDGTTLEADVVILATGYDGKKKLKAIVPEPFRTWLEFPCGVMPLYRGTIHPLIPNMGFVGYVQSNSNLHTSELRSMWLSRLVDEKFRLPSKEKMLDQFFKEMEVTRRSSRFYKRHCISTFSIQHADDLCNDMGLNPWRKSNLLLEAFSPYGSQDYQLDQEEEDASN
ncbi:PREDICTED: probable flavin-containing monooxygenase 1 isoform X2 [Camelina sativa]|uniref:Flavin-containing monooxygenase n=1 Tax=Camelina sativa TaxID=90675 RepID=A0ABM0VQA5_CAMSA|nr:PREDICTED: probable flavin-containing monooxygenase 1 isoform X1 [Camelina sativa]XP_010459585.1 PREDICTED: probable flavin-containing monooxygenase 1 isoform X2 [Camelina sativa]